VLGDIPSLREVWRDAALFVPCDSARALEAAVRSLIADPELRDELSARARKRAMRFTPERMADAYLGVYRSLAAPGRGVPKEMEETRCGS
jgi:glycosyltransferase involved in cell wall biosynthesis